MSVAEILTQIGEADWIVVRHNRARKIYWFRLFAAILALPCLLFLAVLLFIKAQTRFFGEGIYGYVVETWHEIGVELIGRSGTATVTAAERPATAAQGDTLIRGVLLAAQAESKAVMETVGDRPGGIACTWNGSAPLFYKNPDATRCRFILQRDDAVELSATETEWSTTRTQRSLNRWVVALILVVLCAVLWLAFLTPGGRKLLRGLWWDLKGVPPGKQVYSVTRQGLHIHSERNGRRLETRDFAADDLLAVGFVHHSLGYDAAVSRWGPRLRVVCRQETHSFKLERRSAEEFGPALAEFLVAGAVHLGTVST